MKVFMDESQTSPSPELYKVSSSTELEKVMSKTEAITDMAEAKGAIEQQLSTLIQDISTKEDPQLLVYLVDQALNLAVEEEQKYGSHMVEEAFCRQVILESMAFQESSLTIHQKEVSLASISSDVSELLSSTLAGHRARLFAILKYTWDHPIAIPKYFWDHPVAIVKGHVTYTTILDKIHMILETHWKAQNNIQSATTVTDACLIFIMAACYHIVVAIWLGYFAMHAYALYVQAPVSGPKWSSVGLMVASSCLDLVLADTIERGSSLAKFVVLLVWIFLQDVIGMLVISSQEFKDLVKVLRGN